MVNVVHRIMNEKGCFEATKSPLRVIFGESSIVGERTQ